MALPMLQPLPRAGGPRFLYKGLTFVPPLHFLHAILLPPFFPAHNTAPRRSSRSPLASAIFPLEGHLCM